jgi:hypothetical protein
MLQVKLPSTIHTLLSTSAALVTIAVAPLVASAASVNYSGNLSAPGTPRWDEPAFGSTDSPYNVQQFTVDTNGLYSFTTDIPLEADPLLFLYENTFSPNSPGKSNFKAVGFPNIIGGGGTNLTAGLNYFLVTSEIGFPPQFNSLSFSNVAAGSPIVAFAGASNFTNTISGVGNITLNSGSTAVPEPFTILGTLIGGGAALRLRRKLSNPTDRN